jgi:uncharacterized membrane protein
MSIGPVEYIILGFPGNQFKGEIVPELVNLVERGLIRILDLVVISRNDAGDVLVLEVDEDGDLSAMFATLDGEVGGVIGNEDIQHAATSIEPGSSAALLLWEDTWATPFVEAVRNAGGVLIEGSRIPHDLIEELESALASAS